MSGLAVRGAAEEVKARISLPEALRRYGLPTSPRGRIACPIHGGEGPNFAYDQRRFHCFVCGAGGSVIDLVMGLFGLAYPQALVRLDEDFSLGLLLGRGDERSRRQAAEAARRRAAERERREAGERAYRALAAAVCAEVRQLRLRAGEPPPWSGEGEPPPLPENWVEAAHRLPYLEHWLEENDRFEKWEANGHRGHTDTKLHPGGLPGGDGPL